MPELNKTKTTLELWQTTRDWLLLLGYKPNTKFCKEEIITHPDYPAMTAVTDFLDLGNMQYSAVQADASYINEFNYPLLAHIRQPGQEYLQIISSAPEWDKQAEITKHWSGIVLFSEKNTTWENDQNSVYRKESFKTTIFTAVLIIFAIGLLVTSSINQLNITTLIFGLLSLLGLIISIFLLGTELGLQSQIVKQVCGAVSIGGCEKVLKSKYAKGILGITPADASVIYFATQLILYLFNPYFNDFINSLLLISIGCLVIAVLSIYSQAIKLKVWCALCLGVVIVLILQAFTAFFFTSFYFQIPANAIPFIAFLILFTLLMIALQPIKSLIKTNKTNQHKLVELKKWKTDATLFMTQWQIEQQVDTSIWQQDLILGNPTAPILITVACNPYCGPCAKAHTQLDSLLLRFPKIVKVQVRLLCNVIDEKDKRTIAVKGILQMAEKISNNIELQQMLTDWFEWMDYEKWNTKWHAPKNIDVTGRMNEHSKWFNKNNIQFTPTLFYNGRKLPGKYNLNDLEVLLPKLTELLTSEQ